MLSMLVKVPRRRVLTTLSVAVLVTLAYGAYSHGIVAQSGTYEAGVEGQIWQQLPVFGRGVDMARLDPTGTIIIPERPITTSALGAPTFSDSNFPLIADVWPCTTD